VLVECLPGIVSVLQHYEQRRCGIFKEPEVGGIGFVLANTKYKLLYNY
jgi:hypothetical protein